MAKTDLTKGLLSRFDRLQGQRENWETHWQEVADYMQPRKADVTKSRARGDKRNELIFDSSPIQAVELLAASLHGMLTNPSTPWFSLRFKDSSLEMEDEAKLWLENATFPLSCECGISGNATRKGALGGNLQGLDTFER